MKQKSLQESQEEEKTAEKEEGSKANVKYKDGMFRMLFNNEDEARDLYNALNGTNYGKETKIEMQTLDSTLFLDYKNDVSFTVDDKFIVFTEHQSTVSPNMPVRMLSYVARTYEKMLGKEMYSQSAAVIPAPELYVFYNGDRDMPYETEYRLSDNYAAEAPGNSIEAVAKVINISYNENKEVLRRCRTMMEYSRFVHFVNEDLKETGNLDKAMRNAVKQAVSEGILNEFLSKHRAGVLSMEYLFEMSKEEYLKMLREEGLKEGLEAGEHKAQRRIAKNLKDDGMDHALIAKNTGLTIEEVDAL